MRFFLFLHHLDGDFDCLGVYHTLPSAEKKSNDGNLGGFGLLKGGRRRACQKTWQSHKQVSYA
jgi:hypothetical protein